MFDDCPRFHITRDHECGPRGRITQVIIGFHAGAIHLPDLFVVSDNGDPCRITAECRLEHGLIKKRVGIVIAHGAFPQDHIFLMPEPFFGEEGACDHAVEHIQCLVCGEGRHFHVILCGIVSGAGVEIAAECVDPVGNVQMARVSFCSGKDHVLQKMGESAAEEFSFVNAACPHDRLSEDRAAAGTGIYIDLQAVRQFGADRFFCNGWGVAACHSSPPFSCSAVPFSAFIFFRMRIRFMAPTRSSIPSKSSSRSLGPAERIPAPIMA